LLINDGTNFAATSNTMTANQFAKVASAYGNSALSVCLNAGTVGASAYSGSFASQTSAQIGGGGTYPINGHVKYLTYYNTALSTQQLIQVTT
jgi:hypothetical protein